MSLGKFSQEQEPDKLCPVKGEVDEEQTFNTTHATIFDEHDDDERVAGEWEEEYGGVETQQRDRRRLAHREHVGQIIFDETRRLVGAEVERAARRHVSRPVCQHYFRSVET